MKKIKILGLGNEENMNYLIVKKQSNFFEWFSELFNSLGRVFQIREPHKDLKDNHRTKKKKLKDFIDMHEIYNVKNIRIDVFYGKDKVFIIFYSTPKKRKILMNKLEQISKFN